MKLNYSLKGKIVMWCNQSLWIIISAMSVIMITGTSLWLSRQKRRVNEHIGTELQDVPQNFSFS